MTTMENATLLNVLAQSEHTIDGKRVDCKPALTHEDYQVSIYSHFIRFIVSYRQRNTELRKCLLVECQ